jgi:hypothetical protein
MADPNWHLQNARSCIRAAKYAHDGDLREDEGRFALDHLVDAIEKLLRRVERLEARSPHTASGTHEE